MSDSDSDSEIDWEWDPPETDFEGVKHVALKCLLADFTADKARLVVSKELNNDSKNLISILQEIYIGAMSKENSIMYTTKPAHMTKEELIEFRLRLGCEITDIDDDLMVKINSSRDLTDKQITELTNRGFKIGLVETVTNSNGKTCEARRISW